MLSILITTAKFCVKVFSVICFLIRWFCSTDVGIIVAGYGMFPPWILPSATLSRGVISKVISLPSESVNVPSHLTSNSDPGSKMCGVSSSSNISQKSMVSNEYNFCVTRNPEDTCGTSHELMKLCSFPPKKTEKCSPVPVVMQTTCAVYAGGSGGPVVAFHPAHGEFTLSYVLHFDCWLSVIRNATLVKIQVILMAILII